ncbi:hypothetical protein GCM10010136_02540 [Limoniibacter endophyticus]|uniref:Uncharacterized protein n=1 Tax=Limoniibacter endophyticus TaxID=1565040 RepID=A0A8J3DLJ0_9HYPH|nr:hypothetical protein GCM10010136_02540 [Limoniibacter endophyticus]
MNALARMHRVDNERDSYRFEIEDRVTHVDGTMPAVVFWRSRSSRGREMYGVLDGDRERYFCGEVLKIDQSMNK